MKKSTVVILVIIALALGLFAMLYLTRPNLKEFDNLREPRISQKNAQKMLVVEMPGDPSVSSGRAIGKLFGVFFSLKKNHPGLKLTAPRARWPVSLDAKKPDWKGVFGLAVDDTVRDADIPKSTDDAFPVRLTAWQYGTVAEILHIGPYSEETPAIEKLKTFIRKNGYRIVGDHEEEYVRGPGPFSFNPRNYLTIIRYRVVK